MNNIGIKKKWDIWTPLPIPRILLNAMKLHIKVLQLLKKGPLLGHFVKSKLVAAISRTEHKEFDPD